MTRLGCWAIGDLLSGGLRRLDLYGGPTLTPRLASDLCRIWWWLLDFTPLYPFVPYPKEKKQASLKEKKKGSARLRFPSMAF